MNVTFDLTLSPKEFRKQNNVLFSAKIIHSKGQDVLDLNSDGRAQAGEPALVSPSFKQLAEFAKSKELKLLTEDNIPGTLYIADRGAERNTRPIGTLVQEKAPLIETKFVIDYSEEEFLIVGGPLKTHRPLTASEQESIWVNEGGGH